MYEFYDRLTGLLRGRRRLAVATVISTSGSTPRRPGAKMILTEAGEQFYSVGGGALEAMVLEDARAALLSGEPRIREYQLRERGEGAVGMVCGGRATVLIEVVRGPDRLMVFGAGHVGRALVEKAAGLDLEVIVIDDRQEFLRTDRFPAGTELVCAGPGFESGLPEPDSSSYVCVLTRCHRTDLEVLRRLAGKPAAYIGLIGSRRKGLRILSALRSAGLPADYLESIHTPIGIDIGGRTPGEIAVSILAEVIRERNREAPRERRTRNLPAASEP